MVWRRQVMMRRRRKKKRAMWRRRESSRVAALPLIEVCHLGLLIETQTLR